jgi:hypothetical protein
MNTAEFMAALNTVEQDHLLVLDKIQALKETVSFMEEAGGGATRRGLASLRALNGYFAAQFASHIAEEETTLFPVLEKYLPGGRARVARFRLDHEEILRKREELGNCVAFATELEEGLSKMVVRDLVAYGWELWDLLDKHAHEDTQAIHECIAASLADDVALTPA